MTLSFSQHLNGKPTYFPEKIIAALNVIKGQDLVFRTEFDQLHEVVNPTYEEFRAGSCNPLIEHVPKLHTIREDKHDRWRAGMKIHAVINNRTPNRYQFVRVIECTAVQEIEIQPIDDIVVVSVGGVCLSPEEIEILARNDGFDSLDDIKAYFNRDFTGKIIHWTDLRY